MTCARKLVMLGLIGILLTGCSHFQAKTIKIPRPEIVEYLDARLEKEGPPKTIKLSGVQLINIIEYIKMLEVD